MSDREWLQVRAITGPGLDETQEHHSLERLAQGCPTYLKHRSQLLFRREAATRAKFPISNEGFNPGDDHLHD